MKILIKGISIFRGEFEETKTKKEFLISFDSKVCQEFINDVELSEMSICSSNIGFAYIFTKIEREATDDQE